MQLDEVLTNVRDQDAGREMELINPFDGTPTGLRLWVVGPDSDTSHRARIRLADELAEMADADGIVSAANREKARRNCLAAHVLRWDVKEAGEPVSFSTAALLRVLRIPWIEQQVDAFAADRHNFRPGA